MPIRNGQIVNWRRTLNISQYLRDDSLTLMQKAEAVARELRRDCAFTEDMDLDLDWLKDAAEAHDIEGFDDVLAIIYDIADRELIWTGA